nr:uncharacterized mitochondrial protein AtMg00810-like [Tanacetum cinerariifolium]
MKHRSKVGAQMYLTASIPDIMHATCYCARYQAQQTEKHLTAVKRIFQYLKDTIHMGLWYPKDTGFELTAFLDSDHAGCLDSRKSTSGGIQFLGGDKLISCSSKKQDCTSMSFAEAESFSGRAGESQVPDRRNGLLHEMDRSKSGGNDYRQTSKEICMGQYCMPLWYSRRYNLGQRRPPAYIVVISADGKFSHALHPLRQRGYTVILAVPSRVVVSSALRTAGSFVWDWPNLPKTLRSYSYLNSLNEVSSRHVSSNEPNDSMRVQPGDENGLKHELVPPLESSSGQLPLDEIELESLCYMQRKRKPCEIPISREPSYSPIDLMDSQGCHDIISCLLAQSSPQQNQNFHDGSVAIFWDMKTCPVPSNICTEEAAHNIMTALRVHQINGAITRRPLAYIMVISAHGKFSHALHRLRQRGYTVILAVPSRVVVSSALRTAGSFVWDWPNLPKTSRSYIYLNSLNEVSSRHVSSNEPNDSMLVQPGDENGLKHELVPPLESSGGQLPLDEIELESLCYMQRKRKPCEIPISREPSYSPIDLMDS